MEERGSSDGPIGMAKPKKAEEIITGKENLMETGFADRSDTFRGSSIVKEGVEPSPPFTATSHPKRDRVDEK